jgi:hypothetical protein
VILNNPIKVLLLALIIVSSLSIASLSPIFTAANFHTVVAKAKVDATSLSHVNPNPRQLYRISAALNEDYIVDPIADQNSATNTSQMITPHTHLVPIPPYFMFPQQKEIHRPMILQQQAPIQVFASNGTINSLIKTPPAEWIASGNWTLNLSNRNTTYFKTDMTWFNNDGKTSHTHQFQNFRSTTTTSSTAGGNITAIVQPGNNVILNGLMDVGTNHRIVWKNVPSTISIHGGKTITISIADNATNRHFAGQPIFGLVTSFVRK